MSKQNPSIEVAVVMRKARVQGAMSRWQTWRWALAEVMVQQPGFGTEPRRLVQSEDEERWLFPGLVAQLYKDDTEGYYLNATTPAPCWFVLGRMEEEASVADEPLARPEMVSLSYNDAASWLDAQEMVEQVPAPEDVVKWMSAFTEEHFVTEPKKRRRPESFKPLTDRFGNPASVSTDKKFGGGHG
ncbi:MAG: DUF3305 domain-containing protein [Hylemonella sp.]|nr:DUF3305 domain-containing protein [Hylemonella sp.]